MSDKQPFLLHLQKVNASIKNILYNFLHVTVYKFDTSTPKWDRMNVEGPAFICGCNNNQILLIIMNKLDTNEFSLNLSQHVSKVKLQSPYIMLKAEDPALNSIVGLWLQDDTERENMLHGLEISIRNTFLPIQSKLLESPPMIGVPHINSTVVQPLPIAGGKKQNKNITAQLMSVLTNPGASADTSGSSGISITEPPPPMSSNHAGLNILSTIKKANADNVAGGGVAVGVQGSPPVPSPETQLISPSDITGKRRQFIASASKITTPVTTESLKDALILLANDEAFLSSLVQKFGVKF